MTDFEKRIPDEPMIEEWPEPDDYVDDEGDWDDFDDTPVAHDYEVKFMLRDATPEQLDSISRHLFDLIAQELGVSYDNLEELEITED